MPFRPVRCAGSMLVAGLLAGGCSDGDPAEPVAALPSSAPSSAAPASPTPTRPPTQAPTASQARPTPASAAAFVRAYYAAVNKAAVTGSAHGLSTFASRGCNICQANLESVQKLQKAKRRLASAALELSAATPYPLEGTLTTVTIQLRGLGPKIVSNDGRPVSRLRSRARFPASAALVWLGHRWLITDIVEFS